MKERPILFSGPMVSAILDGRKTQTRRIAKPRFDDRKPCEHWRGVNDSEGATMLRHCQHGSEGMGCPYGQPGGRLWVRETWQDHRTEDTAHPVAYRSTWRDELPPENGWRPSIFMPRWASRITLEIAAVRVERLQDISEEGAMAEGCSPTNRAERTLFAGSIHPIKGTPKVFPCARAGYRDLWESINGPGAWDINPWVWVIEFRKL